MSWIARQAEEKAQSEQEQLVSQVMRVYRNLGWAVVPNPDLPWVHVIAEKDNRVHFICCEPQLWQGMVHIIATQMRTTEVAARYGAGPMLAYIIPDGLLQGWTVCDYMGKPHVVR